VKIYPQLAWGFGIVLVIGILYREVKVILEKMPPIVAFNAALDVFAVVLLVIATVQNLILLYVIVVFCILSGVYVTAIYERYREELPRRQGERSPRTPKVRRNT
jgi:hypothetical protein